jgi:signal transduction histidine kinase
MTGKLLKKLGLAPKRPDDYQSLIDDIADVDVTPRSEILLRYALMLGGMGVALLVTKDAVIGILMGTYFIANMVHNILLRQPNIQPTKAQYFLFLTLFLVSATSYSLTAAYFFSFHTPAMMAIGIAGGAAQSMFNLARHRRFGFHALWDTMLIVSLTLFFAISFLGGMETAVEKLVLLVGAISVGSYFAYAQYKTIEMHEALRRIKIEAVQTQKMRAVGQLTAGVAHDFNNLLTVIRGNVELAEISETSQELTQRLLDAKSGADQAAELVGQLLAFSRKAQLRAELLDMSEFLGQFKRVVSRVLPASVEVAVSLDAEIEHLFCDANLLQSSLLNLVINSRDAMHENGRILLLCYAVSAEAIKDTGLKLPVATKYGAISIVDYGPGIPKDSLDKVTEPFFTTKAVGNGSGLGLSTVKGFAEQSGGGLHIECPKSGGTKVTIFLPIDPPS